MGRYATFRDEAVREHFVDGYRKAGGPNDLRLPLMALLGHGGKAMPWQLSAA